MELEQIIKMDDRQTAYMELAQKYLSGTNEERETITNGYPFEVEWQYPDAKRLACKKGERWSCDERIAARLAYYGIAAKMVREEWDLDPRDVIVGIAFEYNVCIVANLDPEEIFLKVAKLAPKDIGKILMDFASRGSEDKNLGAFNLFVKKNEDGELVLSHKD